MINHEDWGGAATDLINAVCMRMARVPFSHRGTGALLSFPIGDVVGPRKPYQSSMVEV